MFRRALDIALLYIKQTFSSRSVLLSSLLMPLIFTFVIAQAIPSGAYSNDRPAAWDLLVVNEAGEVGAAVVERLAADPALIVREVDRETALNAIAEETVPVALFIPDDFEERLRAGERATVQLHATPGTDQIIQFVQRAVQGAAGQVAGSAAAARNMVAVGQMLEVVEPASLFMSNFEAADRLWADVPVLVRTQTIARTPDPNNLIAGGTAQTAPGMLVMFTLFFTIGGGVSLLVEREQGTLRRLLVMPLPQGTVLLGKLLGIFLGGLIQIAILILAGSLLFGVEWGASPLALLLVVLSLALAATSLGVLMAALARTSSQANALSTLVVMSISALGGAWWPLEIVPPFMQQIGHLFPTAWAMDGFSDIITRGLDVEAVLPEVGVLLGFALLFFAVGIWRFRYE